MTFLAIFVSLDTPLEPVVVAMAIPASKNAAANIILSESFFIGFSSFPTSTYETPGKAVAVGGMENCKEFVNAQMVEWQGLWGPLKAASLTSGREFQGDGLGKTQGGVSNFEMDDNQTLPGTPFGKPQCPAVGACVPPRGPGVRLRRASRPAATPRARWIRRRAPPSRVR